MILDNANAFIWVAEHKKTGQFAWWTASTQEKDVKDSIKDIKKWVSNPDEFQVSLFTLTRLLGAVPAGR